MWSDYNDKYEVSSEGHIRNKKTLHVLHEYIGKDGYLRTQFDGKTRLVHRVIATVYIPNPDKLPEVNHMDGNKQNNNISNLEWVTRNDNQKHAYRIGLRDVSGTKNSRNKLSEEDVIFIKNNYIKGDKEFGAIALGRKFRVAPQTINAVTSGQNWNNLGENDD